VAAAAADPHDYHIDLREKVVKAGPSPSDGLDLLARLTADPTRANPVSILQLGLGALQLRDPSQLPLIGGVVAWLERTIDERGLLAYRFPLRHTFALEPPWYSSLAQAEAVSLLVRAAVVLERNELLELAERVAAPLLDQGSALVASTAEGPVLQEYSTEPSSHVLNGWLLSLWGLYDLAHALRTSTTIGDAAAEAFAAGAAALGARIHLYRTAAGWSLYDLYPHPLPNVASPFYHRLHVEQLRRQQQLLPDARIAEVAGEWASAASAPVPYALALLRKGAFRVVRPRWRRLVATAT
jgi:heparosan-N-sulfate-glucuronate 5-epimerase